MSAITLTIPERLFLSRFRRGESQPQAAKYYGVTEWTYRQWEAGRGNTPELLNTFLTPNEACRIMRRRTKRSRSKIAKAIGVTPWWVTSMERGRIDCGRLTAYWFSS